MLDDLTQRMTFEQIAELQVFSQRVITLVTAKPLQLGRVYAAVHPCRDRPTLEAVPAELAATEACRDGTRLDDQRHGLCGQGLGADAGPGRGLFLFDHGRPPNPPKYGALADASGSQPALERTNRAEFGLAVGQGDHHGLCLAAFAMIKRQAQPTLGRIEVADADCSQLGAPQRAGKADQQHGSVPQPNQVVTDRRDQAAQHLNSRCLLLALVLALAGGTTLDAGERFRNAGIVGWHRTAGDTVQVADGGAPKLDRLRREAPGALAGEEGGNVRPAGGQGGEVATLAPSAPDAHGRDIGASRVLGLGELAEG